MPLAFSSDSKRGLVGLINNSNDCFMNTSLQCLAACEALTDFFLQKTYLREINQINHFGTFG